MASNINPDQINETFPVAGQDNPSQGFRDNFSATKNNLSTAQSEITTLQDTTAKLNANNNFQSNELSGAVFIANKVKVFDGGTIGGSQDVNLSNGHYQKFTVSDSISLTFNEWSSANNQQDIVYVELLGNNATPKQLRLQQCRVAVQSAKSQTQIPITVDSASDPIYKFWSYDGGLTVYMQYIDNLYNDYPTYNQ